MSLNNTYFVFRVYTDSMGKTLTGTCLVSSDDGSGYLRVPPDGQESAALLRHAEHMCLHPGPPGSTTGEELKHTSIWEELK